MQINKKLINVSELARQLGISVDYCHKIIDGKRKSRKHRPRIEAFLKSVTNFKESA